MGKALDPKEIFKRSAEEGRRRLDQGLLALVATGFIAGFTIIFGIIAQALVHSEAEPHFGAFATVLGALAFGVGMVFLILGRAELFSENFFDPIAAFFEEHSPGIWSRLLRLWAVTLVLNVVGGAILVFALSVEGALSSEAVSSIISVAVEYEERLPLATFVRSIVGGALVALLSFLVIASQTSGARIAVAFMVGFMLAMGPFEHVVVSFLHMCFGLILGGDLTIAGIAETAGIALVGNLIGGIGLVTLSHAAQAKGEEES